MPRTPAEKEKAEKRRRLERILIPAAAVLVIAVYIIISAVFGKNLSSGKSEPTPAPTEDPCYTVIRRIADELNGTYTEGDGTASASVTSAVDGKDVAVSAYSKNGVVCMQLARNLAVKQETAVTPAPTPEATESLFVIDRTAAPSETAAPATEPPLPDLTPYAEEVWSLLSRIFPDGQDGKTAKANIEDALKLLVSGEEKKVSVVIGIYVAEFSYSTSDELLKLKCEPV